MTLLLKQQGEGFQITEGLIIELARSFSARSMALLLKQRGGEVKVTEAVVKAAAENTESGKKVMAFLLKRRGGKVKVLSRLRRYRTRRS